MCFSGKLVNVLIRKRNINRQKPASACSVFESTVGTQIAAIGFEQGIRFLTCLVQQTSNLDGASSEVIASCLTTTIRDLTERRINALSPDMILRDDSTYL